MCGTVRKRKCEESQEREKDSLSNNILGHLRDLAPLIFREVKATSHDLFPHVLWDGATVVFGVEGRIATQHYVDDHTQRPQITALENN